MINVNNINSFNFNNINNINLINSGIQINNNIQIINNFYDINSVRLGLQLQNQLINIYNQALGANNAILSLGNSMIFTDNNNELRLILMLLLNILLSSLYNSQNNYNPYNYNPYNYNPLYGSYPQNYIDQNYQDYQNYYEPNYYDNYGNYNYDDLNYISESSQFSNSVNNQNTTHNSNTQRVGDSNVRRGGSSSGSSGNSSNSVSNRAGSKETSEETYYHGKRTKIEGNTYYDKDGDGQRILYKRGNSFASVGIGAKVEEAENGMGRKARVSAKGTVQADVGNDSGIKVEGEGYIEAGAWVEGEGFTFGSTRRVNKEGNDYIVYRQGVSGSAGLGVSFGARGAFSVYNGYDSITAEVDISKGLEFSNLKGAAGAGIEAQRGAALNTNNWLLEFWGALGIDIGDIIGLAEHMSGKLANVPVLGKVLKLIGNIGKLGKIGSLLADYGLRISLSGKVQLDEAANQSKQEIKSEADKIFNQELNQMKQQTVNDLKQNKKVSKSEIQNKAQEIKNKRNELYKKALLKAWNSKQHVVKQKLKTEARNRLTNILPKFARELINNRIAPLIHSSLSSVPRSVRDGIINVLQLAGRAGTFIDNSLLLITFMKPIENVINEVKVTDFFKDLK
jgi:hypothetical protein